MLEKSYQQGTFLLTSTCQGFFIYQLGHDVCEQTSCLQEIQMGSLLSPFFSYWMQRSEAKQQQEFLLLAQDALDYACISTRDFNFLYTELRLGLLKGHTLCNRVGSAICFIY